MSRLEGKVAVITGAAGGIGRAAAKLFVDEGARVALVDLDEAALREVAGSLGEERASYTAADVTQPDQTQAYINAAVERWGGIDILLANAGIEGVMSPITEYPIDVFDRVMAVNVRGVWLGVKYAMPVMSRGGGGSIVVTSSTAGINGTPEISAYGISKHAVIGLMRAAALEGAEMGIRVNTVNPAPIETRMMRSIEEMRAARMDDSAVTAEEVKQSTLSRMTLGRYGEPEEVAHLMLFLASDESSYCTGGVYMVDGGRSAGGR
ncbi:MAG: glucose 1-dehydrogenase [Dehalococcoidia bacterium]|nr:glucose 1-dehydrogenase [Dehalococcoidia bacterium]